MAKRRGYNGKDPTANLAIGRVYKEMMEQRRLECNEEDIHIAPLHGERGEEPD